MRGSFSTSFLICDATDLRLWCQNQRPARVNCVNPKYILHVKTMSCERKAEDSICSVFSEGNGSCCGIFPNTRQRQYGRI